MDEGRIERCEDELSKSRKTFSFSIEKILKRDDATKDEAEFVKFPVLSCFRSPHIPYSEGSCKTVSPQTPSPCQSHPPISAFPVCRHPVCPIPTNPIIHTDPYYDVCTPRAFSRYLSMSSGSPRIHDVGYLRGRPFDYDRGLLRYFQEAEMTTTVGFVTKQALHSEDRNDAKRKGGQVRFSHMQSVELERIFSLQKYISPQERKQLSRFLQLSERQVKTWFQNRRAKWRRIKIEAEMRRRMSREKAARQRYTTSEEKSLSGDHSSEDK